MTWLVSLAVSLAVTLPPAGGDLDYQLGGARAPDPSVRILVRDRTEDPVQGLYNICYVNGFQTQPDAKRFWRQRWSLVLKQDGRPVVDEDWGEWLLDTRRARGVARVVGRWVDRCAADGFDAVEFDNLDSFTRSHGLLKHRDNKRLARRLVDRAHRAGLAVGQKNWAELDGTKLGFDFAVAEECGRYDECGRYVSSYGDRVLVVEYRQQDFENTCARFGAQLPVVLRDRDLTPDGTHQYC